MPAMPDEDEGGREEVSWLRRFSAAVLTPALRAGWDLRVTGLENVPRTGAAIVACNHVSLVDGLALALAATPARALRFLGKAELFRVPVLGWYLRSVGMLPLDRGKGDVAAMRAALGILKGGGCLGLFPEGTRSKTGSPGRPKPGISFLAGQAAAPVVPARVVNTEKFPRLLPIEVRFGPSLRFEGDPRDRARCQAFAEAVMRRIAAL